MLEFWSLEFICILGFVIWDFYFRMKPIIGITPDIIPPDPPLVKGGQGGLELKLKKDCVNAVAEAGGLPFIIAPFPLFPLPTGERDRVRGDVESIADKIDGLMLSGGGDIPPEYYGETISIPSEVLKPAEKERIDFEIELFREVMKRHKPILGICYGMQLVNAALGGTLYQDIEIQIGSAVNHRKGEHKIKIVQPSILSPLTDTFRGRLQPSVYTVNSSHHQAVKNPGKGMEVFAMSDDGIIEGVYKPDYPFLVCCQWHPERDMERGGISLSLFKSFVSDL